MKKRVLKKSGDYSSGTERVFTEHASSTFQKMADDFEKYGQRNRGLRELAVAAKTLKAFFSASRTRGVVHDFDSAISLTRGIEDGLEKLQSRFLAENAEYIEDGSVLSHFMSLFLKTACELYFYRGAIAVLGAAESGGADRWAGVLEGLKTAYVKRAEGLHALAEAHEEESLTDATSTILRYLDLYHENVMIDIASKPAETANENYIERTMRLSCHPGNGLDHVRSWAHHEGDTELEEGAVLAKFSFSAYRGALAATYYVATNK